MIEQIKHLERQIISKPDKLSISDKCRIEIKCNCGKINNISTRNLVRKWSNEEYKCKSCHVKTYVNNEERLTKWRTSVKELFKTEEHRLRCSNASKKLWDTPELRKRITEAVIADNKTNPKKAIARAVALEAFKKKHNVREHLAKIRQQQDGKVSIPEQIIQSILKEKNIEFIPQYTVGYYAFDICVPHKKLLIEIQGEYWHKETQSSDSGKATYAANLGYDVKHIWEHEFSEINKVDNLISSWIDNKQVEQIDFKFNDISIKEVCNKDARVFLGKYHYLPALSKSGFHLGAYLQDKLIACVTFSAITRNEMAKRLDLNSRQIKEVGRFCIAPQYHKRNFASWFLSKTTRIFMKSRPEVKRLISFADTTLHEGTVYKSANWQYDGDTEKNYVYKSADNYLIHKKTVWDRAKKMNMSENDYAIKNNYIKVWSKAKKRFLYPSR